LVSILQFDPRAIHQACIYLRKACPELELVRLVVGSAHMLKGVSRRLVRFFKVNLSLEYLMYS
jgi:hypothetical protein